MIPNVINGFAGWSAGYTLGLFNTWEEEYRQGENYYLASFPQAMKIATLASVGNFVAGELSHGPTKIALRIGGFVAPIFSLVFFPLCAAIKHGNYHVVAAGFNSIKPKWCPSLPLKLNERVVTVCTFIVKHSSDIIRVAEIVSGIAVAIFLNPYYGGALLGGLLLETLDRAGYIPRKISLFNEKYLFTVAAFGNLIYGGILQRIGSLFIIGSTISPKINKFLQQKVDQLFQAISSKYFNKSWVTLSAFEAPLQSNKHMTFDEIKGVLADTTPCQPNPAHCSKPVIQTSQLPKNEDFNKLLIHFDRVDWDKKYGFIMKKFIDDDRILEILHAAFPEKTKELLKNPVELEACISALAEQNHMTKEKYAHKLLRQQMEEVVSVLSSYKRVKGQQCDLQEAIDITPFIIAYLDELYEIKDLVAFEDVLLKFAIEGGGYCSRGVKRVANELLDTILREKNEATLKSKDLDPTAYETKIAAGLERLRYLILQMTISQLKDILPPVFLNDVHAFDFFRTRLLLGFYPLTEYERRNINFGLLINWEQFSIVRDRLLKAYGEVLDDAFAEIIEENGAIHFGTFMQRLIQENRHLSDVQKEELLEMYTEADKAGQKAFRRLALVALGVVKKPAITP